MSEPISNRYDFVLFFDVADGNPNGDPDAGNLPRIDPENGHGLVTDVCLKRKVRNYVALLQPNDLKELFKEARPEEFKIFVKEKAVLNRLIEEAYSSDPEIAEALDQRKKKKGKKDGQENEPPHPEDLAKDWMCRNYYDIRTFGAVMSTGDKTESDNDDEEKKSKLKKTAGQVRGPVQITFARSVEPVVTLEHSITRMAVTNEKDLEKERTMGRKYTVPYGLYRAHGFVSAPLAAQTGFGQADLDLLWQAFLNMFEHDRSAARGQMATRGLIVFKHASRLGNAPAHVLFDLVQVRRAPGAEERPPRAFGDYQILAPSADQLPEGVEMLRLV